VVLGVDYLEGSCTHYVKHSIAVHVGSRIVKGISDRVEKYFLTILVPKCYNIVTVIFYHTDFRKRRETQEKYMKKIMLALILCLVTTPAFAEKEVVIRDKNGTIYLVTYNCRVSAVRAWASEVAVGETIKISGRDGRRKICTITKVQAFA